MVLAVCRSLLRDPNDVDDAFQATFLVLVRRAESVRHRDLLGPWLHGVARRIATRARADAARRRERQATGPEPLAPADHLDRLDERASIHDEVERLPMSYRAAVVLCYFEGRTHEEARARAGMARGDRPRPARPRPRPAPRPAGAAGRRAGLGGSPWPAGKGVGGRGAGRAPGVDHEGRGARRGRPARALARLVGDRLGPRAGPGPGSPARDDHLEAQARRDPSGRRPRRRPGGRGPAGARRRPARVQGRGRRPREDRRRQGRLDRGRSHGGAG